MNWQEKELQDVCSLITDGAHNSPKSVESGLPMASVKDLTSFGINLETSRLISEDDFHRLIKMNCQPRKGDILIAKDGASALDTICEIKQNIDVVLLSSVAILRPNPEKIVSPYLRYYLESPITRQYMKSGFITGAAIPRVVLEDFKRVKIRIPPLPTQRKIAAILSAYDDLIENNTRRIQILEEIAQAIYRQWFVEFKFPGHEAVRMVDSGTELGMLPEGWEVEELDNLIEFQKGRKAKYTFDTPTEDSYSVLSINGLRNVATQFTNDERIVLIHPEDIAMVMDGASSGEVFIAKEGAIGSTIGVYRPINKDKLSPYLLYLFLSANYKVISDNNTGVAIPHANKDFINRMNIILPNKNLLYEFDNLMWTLYSLKNIFISKNVNLQQTRDLLLPKLVSGELDVSELPIDVGF
jgi:type I restriction enzyme, S subunit